MIWYNNDRARRVEEEISYMACDIFGMVATPAIYGYIPTMDYHYGYGAETSARARAYEMCTLIDPYYMLCISYTIIHTSMRNGYVLRSDIIHSTRSSFLPVIMFYFVSYRNSMNESWRHAYQVRWYSFLVINISDGVEGDILYLTDKFWVNRNGKYPRNEIIFFWLVVGFNTAISHHPHSSLKKLSKNPFHPYLWNIRCEKYQKAKIPNVTICPQ